MLGILTELNLLEGLGNRGAYPWVLLRESAMYKNGTKFGYSHLEG